MKKTVLVLGSAIVLLFTACTKEDATGLVLQKHDENRMLDSMHAIMSRMEAMTMTMDPEIDFARMMIMHHQGAINMANVQISAGSNDSLKRFAQKVIRDQQSEIQQLQTILATQTVNNMDMEYMNEQMENMKKMDAQMDVQLVTGNIDNDFATIMMVHHQAAIDDASGYLHHGNNAQLKTIANNIIKAQTMEIQELGKWLMANKR